jgi:hypothetical protein
MTTDKKTKKTNAASQMSNAPIRSGQSIKFNPRFNEFLKQNPNISMLKLSWAFFWRLQLVLLPFSLVLMFLLAWAEKAAT